MLRRLGEFLYGSESVSFGTRLPLGQAVAALRGATSRSVLHSLFRERVVGTVSEHKVSLQRAIPFVANSFKPFFKGRFVSEGGKVELSGSFAMSIFVKVFMTFWLGFCVLWTLIAIAFVVAEPVKVWFFPLAGIAMVLAGLGLVQFGKWLSRNDRAFISQVISQALSRNVA